MSSFGKAFAAARKSGKKTFSFGGKSYNTKVAKATPAKGPIPATRPDTAKTAATKAAPRKPVQGPPASAKQKTPSAKDYPANASSRKSVSNDQARYNMAKAGKRDLPGTAFAGVKPLSIGARIKDSVRVGQKAVDRGAVRDRAAAANPNPKAAIQSMLDGMDKLTKKKRK